LSGKDRISPNVRITRTLPLGTFQWHGCCSPLYYCLTQGFSQVFSSMYENRKSSLLQQAWPWCDLPQKTCWTGLTLPTNTLFIYLTYPGLAGGLLTLPITNLLMREKTICTLGGSRYVHNTYATLTRNIPGTSVSWSGDGDVSCTPHGKTQTMAPPQQCSALFPAYFARQKRGFK
jgi:hypothetical protein